MHQLLAAWQPQPCTLCQLHSTSSGASSKGTRSRAVSSTSSKEAGNAVHAAIDRVFRQQQVLIAQQQRQLLALQVSSTSGNGGTAGAWPGLSCYLRGLFHSLNHCALKRQARDAQSMTDWLLCDMQVELSSREQVLLEADAVLAEANRRIAALAAWASQSAQQQPALQTQQQRPTAPGMNASAATSSRRLLSSSSQGSRPGTSLSGSSGAAPSAAGGSAGSCRVDAAAGSVQQVYGVVLEQCRSLLTWCRESQARIARCVHASAFCHPCQPECDFGYPCQCQPRLPQSASVAFAELCGSCVCVAPVVPVVPCSTWPGMYQTERHVTWWYCLLLVGPRQLLQHSAEGRLQHAPPAQAVQAAAGPTAGLLAAVEVAASSSGKVLTSALQPQLRM